MERRSHDQVAALMRKALAAGATRLSASSVRWLCHADCENPWVQTHVGRPADEGSKFYAWDPSRKFTLHVEIWLRCNRCPNCNRYRSRLWRWRINYELMNAPRSWFGTLTMAPERHAYCEALARVKEGGPTAFYALEPWRQRKAVLNVSAEEVTRYMKRLRKKATDRLRFVCVTEYHKSGLPHYHILVHEQVRGCVTHRALSKTWTWGFEKWRVAPNEPRIAGYLCKYLTKSNVARVRASVRYGRGGQLD